MTDTNIDPDGLLAAAADDTTTARKLLDDAAARLGEYSETVPVSNYAQAAAAIATGYAQLANIGVQVASNAGAATQNERIFELQSAVADAHRAMEARMRAEQAEIEARTAKLAELDVATLAAAGQREERAVAEARPHDDEPPAAEPLPFTSDDIGKRIRFPHTGSVDVVLAVDEAAQTLTFAVPDDHGDNATESFADLVAVDAEVLR